MSMLVRALYWSGIELGVDVLHDVWRMGVGSVGGSCGLMAWKMQSRRDLRMQCERMQEAICGGGVFVRSCTGARGSAIRVPLRGLRQGGLSWTLDSDVIAGSEVDWKATIGTAMWVAACPREVWNLGKYDYVGGAYGSWCVRVKNGVC